MSDAPLGRYHFLAWSRRGIGASVNNPDGGSLPSRSTLDVQLGLTANGTAVSPAPDNKVQLFGPGDVAGIDPRHIIRTEPRHTTVNYEPNYLCGIEFDHPDLPWMFTPASPKGDRLRPWVALIVLKVGEFTAPNVAPNPLPVIDVTTLAPLQDLSESWNWAHVQVSGDDDLAQTLATAPGHVISRLVCPRRLDPETSYTAFLVPAFEIGRQAGLGNDVSAMTTADPVWKSGTAVPLRLPVYYRFEFHTSDEGDFESLVRRLTPRVLPAEVGERPLDVSQPMPNFPSAGTPLELEGALHSIASKPTNWTGADKDTFQTALQAFVNLGTSSTDDPAAPNADDPRVVPPIYGRWHAGVTGVNKTGAGWVDGLNLDPRNRAAGGMGTQVVLEERTQLMASAWQQVAGVIKANQMLRQAQLARAALLQLFRQHFQPVISETLMYLTAPVHARILGSPITVRAIVRASRVPERMLSATFRRVSRPRRRIGVAPAARNQLITKVNAGQISIVPAPKPPGGMVSIEQVSSQHPPVTVPTTPWWQRPLLWILLLLVLLLVLFAGLTVGWGLALILGVVVAAGVIFAFQMLAPTPPPTPAPPPIAIASLTPQAADAAPQQSGFQILTTGTQPTASSAPPGPDSAQALAFRNAIRDHFGALQSTPSDPPALPALNLDVLRQTVLTRLDPTVTVPARMRSMVSYSTITWRPLDPIEPIMAAPEFPQAMYAPLRDLSEQYILPGVELIPPDTMGLLQTNHAFIEAYMVGLNHEMARQLLWNSYPTDQRGSYFRQFWDVSAYVRQPGDPTDPDKLRELLKDIPPVHTWPKAAPLGDHENRTDVVVDNVVLIVRGELFKRYPNAIVYAGKAKRDAQGHRVLDETDERYPIFRGTLTPDMTFLGFNLSAADARGGTPKSPEGFFFVFQEQPSEPRFGLEPKTQNGTVTRWADLSWTNFSTGGTGNVVPDVPLHTSKGIEILQSPWRMASRVFQLTMTALKLPDFLSPAVSPSSVAIVADAADPNDPNNKWGVNSAQTAYILLRLPFRILVHADLMMPNS
jgi:hypothetical protein